MHVTKKAEQHITHKLGRWFGWKPNVQKASKIDTHTHLQVQFRHFHAEELKDGAQVVRREEQVAALPRLVAAANPKRIRHVVRSSCDPGASTGAAVSSGSHSSSSGVGVGRCIVVLGRPEGLEGVEHNLERKKLGVAHALWQRLHEHLPGRVVAATHKHNHT